jgi:hypothetical protein
MRGIIDVGVADNHKFVTELGSMPRSILKSIVVIDPSPYVDMSGTLLSVPDINQVKLLCGAPNFRAGSNRYWNVFVWLSGTPLIFKIKIIGQFVGAHLATDVHECVSSRGVSAISEDGYDAPCHHSPVRIKARSWGEAFHKYMRPLDSAVVKKLAVGGLAELNSEDGDSDGSGSGNDSGDNRCVVCQPKPCRTYQAMHNDSPIIGMTITGLIIAIAGFFNLAR